MSSTEGPWGWKSILLPAERFAEQLSAYLPKRNKQEVQVDTTFSSAQRDAEQAHVQVVHP